MTFCIVESRDPKQEIIKRYFREFDGGRMIAHDLQIGRDTVGKLLAAYIESAQITKSTDSKEPLLDFVCSTTKYNA